MNSKMKILLSVVVMSFVMVGCGSSGSSSGGGVPPAPVDPITQKDGILIMHNYPADLCLSNELRYRLESGHDDKNLIIRAEPEPTGCSDYNRPSNGVACAEYYDVDLGNDACVVGFNVNVAIASADGGGSSKDFVLERKIESVSDTLLSEL